MLKRDEGYVLAYVTAVLLVFCLVATAILTGALRNLEAQQDAIARMEDKYAAQGMIEKAVVQLKAASGDESKIEATEGLLVTDIDGGGWTIVAQSGTIIITCTYDASYKCLSYGTGTAEIPAGPGEVPG